MNKADFVSVVASKVGVTKGDTLDIVTAVFDSISEVVKDGQDVTINGFGKFFGKRIESRDRRNPATGESFNVPAYTTFKFKPAPALKKIG